MFEHYINHRMDIHGKYFSHGGHTDEFLCSLAIFSANYGQAMGRHLMYTVQDIFALRLIEAVKDAVCCAVSAVVFAPAAAITIAAFLIYEVALHLAMLNDCVMNYLYPANASTTEPKP